MSLLFVVHVLFRQEPDGEKTRRLAPPCQLGTSNGRRRALQVRQGGIQVTRARTSARSAQTHHDTPSEPVDLKECD